MKNERKNLSPVKVKDPRRSIKTNYSEYISPDYYYSLGGSLGSGQFGDVFHGTWECSRGSIEVAVKTLKESSDEDDKVRFLQEAAIMGQFKHPNVVTMHGVVTEGEPVSI